MNKEEIHDSFEETIRREVCEIDMNNFYNKIPDRDGIPIAWKQSLCAMVGDSREEFEAVLAGIRNSTMIDAFKTALGDNPDDEDLDTIMHSIAGNHSEMRINETAQKFVENVEVAIGRSGVDREVLMQYIDSIPVRHAYNEFVSGILFAVKKTGKAGCRKSVLRYLNLLDAIGELDDFKLKFAKAVCFALNDKDPDYSDMENMLEDIGKQLMEDSMPDDQIDRELLLPIFIELRRMGYTVQDLRI